MLGGFQQRKGEIEARNIDEGRRAADQETKIFSTLLGSDDPEVQHLALTGLLDSANPRRKKGGLRGWVGETNASPYLSQVQALINTPKQVPNPAAGTLPPGADPRGSTLPSRQMSGGIAAPEMQPQILETDQNPAGSAAQPATSPVTGGPPPTPTSYSQSPPVPNSISQPRQVFMDPIEKLRQQSVAKAGADVEGDIEAWTRMGFSQQQALEQVQAERLRKTAGSGSIFQSVQGEVPDGQGGFRPVFGVFDRALGKFRDPNSQQVIEGFRPRTTSASNQDLGMELRPLANALFGKLRGFSQEESNVLLQAQDLRKSQLTTQQALSHASQMLPNANLDQQMALANYLKSATAAPITAQTATGGPPTPTATAGATPAAGGPPAPTTPTTAPGGPPALGTNLPADLSGASKETGKPLAPAVAQTIAKAKSTNDLIDQALAALEPFKDDNTLQGALNLTAKYRQGQYDPISSAAAQLSDLAGLQSSAQSQLTAGASRALKFYTDRRQHVPRLPSGRQGLANSVLPAGMVQSGSIALAGDEGGFDSPKMMYQKLLGAKANNQSFIREIEQSTTLTPVPSYTPATPNTPPPAPTGAPYKDASGAWIIP